MFSQCGILKGRNNIVVLVVPEILPANGGLKVSISPTYLRFCDHDTEYGKIEYDDRSLYDSLARFPQIGLVEYTGEGDFPEVITNTAYVEVLTE